MAKVAIILTHGFADWEYALIAGTGGPFYGLDVRFFAPQTGQIHSQGGLLAVISQKVTDIPDWSPDVVAVIGGTVWTTDAAPDLDDLLKAHHSQGGVVAGICGGTLALARAGLLNQTPHTSNDADFLKEHAEGYSGAEHFCASATAVTGERVITAPGTAPVSFAAAIFEKAGLDPNAVQQFKRMLAAEHA